jgi:hypothetical protein
VIWNNNKSDVVQAATLHHLVGVSHCSLPTLSLLLLPHLSNQSLAHLLMDIQANRQNYLFYALDYVACKLKCHSLIKDGTVLNVH